MWTASAVACTPLRDLDEYSRQIGEREAGAANAGEIDGLEPREPDSGAATAERPGAVMLSPGTMQGDSAQAPDRSDADTDAGDPEVREAGAPLPSDAGGACDPGELVGPDGHCYFLEASLLSWSAARSLCQERGPGWDLASVRSAAENEFLGGLLTLEAWIGASDAEAETTWVWVNDDVAFWSGTAEAGSAVGGAYVNWNPTEPNGGTATNCARALPSPEGSTSDAPWADLACDQTLGAVCERYD